MKSAYFSLALKGNRTNFKLSSFRDGVYKLEVTAFLRGLISYKFDSQINNLTTRIMIVHK